MPAFNPFFGIQVRLLYISKEFRGTLGTREELYIIYPSGTVAPVVKNPLASVGDITHMGLIPGSGRSPGGGHGNPL